MTILLQPTRGYLPGEWSREYHALPATERARISDEVDARFRETTGVFRTLSPENDKELVRTWLRIRDEVMGRREPARFVVSKSPGPQASTGMLITGSVGDGGHNYQKDVLIVKHLLGLIPDVVLYDDAELVERQPDGVMAIVVRMLATDGSVGSHLIDLIRRFQSRVMKRAHPDGLVEPGKKNLNELLRFALHAGEILPVTDLRLYFGPSSVVTLTHGRFLFAGQQFHRGHIVPCLDGRRVILSINNFETVFLLLDRSGPGNALHDLNPLRGRVGYVYVQMTSAFIEEYLLAFDQTTANTLAPLQTMIEVEFAS